jgi:hypothetical protein
MKARGRGGLRALEKTGAVKRTGVLLQTDFVRAEEVKLCL